MCVCECLKATVKENVPLFWFSFRGERERESERISINLIAEITARRIQGACVLLVILQCKAHAKVTRIFRLELYMCTYIYCACAVYIYSEDFLVERVFN